MARIQGRWIDLREIREDDADAIVSLRAEEGREFLGRTSRQGHLAWLRRHYQVAEDDFYFVVESRQTAEVIGAIALYNVDWNAGVGEWGRWVVKRGACRTYAPLESCYLLLGFAFEELGLIRVYSRSRLGNRRVMNFHLRRLGQSLDDIRAGASRCRDPDTYLVSVTAPRFRALAPQIRATLAGIPPADQGSARH